MLRAYTPRFSSSAVARGRAIEACDGPRGVPRLKTLLGQATRDSSQFSARSQVATAKVAKPVQRNRHAGRTLGHCLSLTFDSVDSESGCSVTRSCEHTQPAPPQRREPFVAFCGRVLRHPTSGGARAGALRLGSGSGQQTALRTLIAPLVARSLPSTPYPKTRIGRGLHRMPQILSASCSSSELIGAARPHAPHSLPRAPARSRDAIVALCLRRFRITWPRPRP